MFLKLGFLIHPTQELAFLGFVFNTISMTIGLTPGKAANVQKACENLLNQDNPSIREVAHIIGLTVCSFPGVQFGDLHYRYLEHNKTVALKVNKGDYDAIMTLSLEATADLHWWIHDVTSGF